MALTTLRRLYVFYIHLILLHSVKSVRTTGVYFKLIKGTEKEGFPGDTAPLIRNEFFQCAREQSCTHLMQLANSYVTIHGFEELRKREDNATSIYEKVKTEVRSCLDLYHAGVRKNGLYNVQYENETSFQVFCDFESEAAESVWTLVTSFSLQNSEAFRVPLYSSHARSEKNPNWAEYRLRKQRMQNIRAASTLWRATCSFPRYKSDIYRDYMKADFKQADIFEVKGMGECLRIAYINVRGHEGRNVKVPFWQLPTDHIHTDTNNTLCEFDARAGSVFSEDNFGTYANFNRAFRCAESDDSTTQYWFGGTV